MLLCSDATSQSRPTLKQNSLLFLRFESNLVMVECFAADTQCGPHVKCLHAGSCRNSSRLAPASANGRRLLWISWLAYAEQRIYTGLSECMVLCLGVASGVCVSRHAACACVYTPDVTFLISVCVWACLNQCQRVYTGAKRENPLRGPIWEAQMYRVCVYLTAMGGPLCCTHSQKNSSTFGPSRETVWYYSDPVFIRGLEILLIFSDVTAVSSNTDMSVVYSKTDMCPCGSEHGFPEQ